MSGRKIIVMRHGERVDFEFGRWMETCFDKNGNYTRQNLNQPEKLPSRKSSPESFTDDTPLTQAGCFLANLRGQGFRSVLKEDFEIYTSPALRCIQTATNVLKGFFGDCKDFKNKIKVEPCLFEWTEFHGHQDHKMPLWMDSDESLKAGYPVDFNYKPFISAKNLKQETCDEYYERSHNLIRHLLKSTDKDLLLVGHGMSPEVCTRQLLGLQPREDEIWDICAYIPYCGMIILEENRLTKTFEMMPFQPQLQITYSEAHPFNGNKLLS